MSCCTVTRWDSEEVPQQCASSLAWPTVLSIPVVFASNLGPHRSHTTRVIRGSRVSSSRIRFFSIPEMVVALYPQQWLPYRYLVPLAFDKWDAVGVMWRSLSSNSEPECQTVLSRLPADTMVLLSEHDEVFSSAIHAVRIVRARSSSFSRG